MMYYTTPSQSHKPYIVVTVNTTYTLPTLAVNLHVSHCVYAQHPYFVSLLFTLLLLSQIFNSQNFLFFIYPCSEPALYTMFITLHNNSVYAVAIS